MSTAPLRGEAQPSTPSQRARRQRILEAAITLASKGGFEAVQMREVAERADVALGTLYRYFPSKIHLLVAVMRTEVEALRERVDKRPPEGDTAEERVVSVLMRATRALQREPELADAMIRALMFADASAADDVQGVDDVMSELIGLALEGDGAQIDPEQRATLSRILGMVWWSSLITWLAGRATIQQMRRDLENAAHLMLS